jgi:large conductance mechanosensitive channel
MTYADLNRASANVFAWGNFLTVIINSILLALIIFWMVKTIYAARASVIAPPPLSVAEDVALLCKIRDLRKR